MTQDNNIPKTPLKFLWFTTKPYFWLLLLGVSFHLGVQLVNTYIAYFIGNFADTATSFVNANDFVSRSLLFVLLMTISFTLFRLTGFTAIVVVLKQHRLAFLTVKKYLLEHSHQYFTNRFAGSIASKLFHAGDRSGELLLMCYYGAVRLVVSFVSTGALILFFNLWLGCIYFLILFVTIIINYILVAKRRPYVVAYSKANSKYRGSITDVVSNVQAVRQYARKDLEFHWLGKDLDEMITKDEKQWRMAEWNHVINNIMALILLIAMVGGMYWLQVNNLTSLGALITVMILMYRVSGVMIDLGDWMNRFIRTYGEVEEGLEEIFIEHEIVDKDVATLLEVNRANIAWKDVTFDYEGVSVFRDFDLHIAAGQRVGLVGHSGAGKTTFVSLLLRQYDLGAGAIEIDGRLRM